MRGAVHALSIHDFSPLSIQLLCGYLSGENFGTIYIHYLVESSVENGLKDLSYFPSIGALARCRRNVEGVHRHQPLP
jgi:hypothetical protein